MRTEVLVNRTQPKFLVLLLFSILYPSKECASFLNRPDSIRNLITNSSTNSRKAEVYEELAWYFKDINNDSLLHYANIAKKLALESDNLFVLSSANNRVGDYYLNTGNYQLAIIQYRRAYLIRSRLNLPSPTAEAARNVGLAATQASQMDTAMKYLRIALDIFKSENKSERIASTQNLIASVHIEQGNFFEAINLLNKNLEVKSNQNTIANTCYYLGMFYEETREYQKALKYANRSIYFTKKIDDTRGLLVVKMLQAAIYAKLGKNHNASKTYNELENLAKDFAFNPSLQIKIKTNLANFHFQKRNLDSSKLYLRQARALIGKRESPFHYLLFKTLGDYYYLSKELDSAEHFYQKALHLTEANGLESSTNLFYNLSSVYAQKGRYEESRNYLYQYQRRNDSLYKTIIKAKSSIHNLELETESAKNDLAKEKLKSSRLATAIILAVGIGITLLLFLIYQREKNRKKVLLRDKEISEQKINALLQNQELESIANVLEVQEKERLRIAQDLHDRLGGMLATLKLLFHDVQLSIGGLQEKSQQSYDKALSILDGAGDEVRRVAHNLVTSDLKNHGLKVALEELAQTIENSKSIDFEFVAHGISEKIESEKEAHIYRIAQELISNTLNHAQATEISMQILRDDNRLSLIYEDNGIGFDPENFKPGMGIQSVRSRVAKMKGQMEIDSGKGAGTTFNIQLPL